MQPALPESSAGLDPRHVENLAPLLLLDLTVGTAVDARDHREKWPDKMANTQVRIR